VESATGRRGVIDAGTHKPDLAIVDLALPDMDGVDVVRRIREWSPMPVIVLSARVQERTKIEALDAGANDYVTKPFAIGELLARVRSAFASCHARRGRIGDVAARGCRGRPASPDGAPRRAAASFHADRVSPAGVAGA
jgi:two-component system KDP operon response regulator KdpE